MLDVANVFLATPVNWSRPVSVPAFVKVAVVLRESASPVRSELESVRVAVVVAIFYELFRLCKYKENDFMSLLAL